MPGPDTTNTWRRVNEESILFGIGNSAFGCESQRYQVRCKEAHLASATDACGHRFEHLDIHTATVILVLAVHRRVSGSLTQQAAQAGGENYRRSCPDPLQRRCCLSLATVFLLAVPVAVVESLGVRSSPQPVLGLAEGQPDPRVPAHSSLFYALVLAAVFSLFVLLPPVPHFHSLPVWARPFVTIPVFFLLLLPTQWVFISLTLAYRNLRASRPGN